MGLRENDRWITGFLLIFLVAIDDKMQMTARVMTGTI
jgi:hypothetical protein